MNVKEELFKQINKQMMQSEGELEFIPKPQATFFSDEFQTLPRAAQLHELGVHEITSSKKQFTLQDYDFTSLYESFLYDGFELTDLSPEELRKKLNK